MYNLKVRDRVKFVTPPKIDALYGGKLDGKVGIVSKIFGYGTVIVDTKDGYVVAFVRDLQGV